MSHSDDNLASGDGRARRGHAVLDLPSRDFKAIKIARLIDAVPGSHSRRMLEIGTGSGGIARYFGHAGPMGWSVESIDVEDVRLVTDGFSFTRVDDVQLPFADDSFDVVISNHVIEHVGDAMQQDSHLMELARVLRPDGIAYLAVPNRWMLVEPHYRLPFLSWLPQRAADAYVRLFQMGEYYDCRPLTVRSLESKLDKAGFEFTQSHAEAMRLTFELERPDAIVYRCFLRFVPDAFYAAMRRLFPTLIYVLTPRRGAGGSP